MKKQLKKIDNKWVRLIAMTVVFINAAAIMFGYELLPFDNETIIAGISVGALAGTEIWNHWKNNNWTPEAERAQKYLDGEKEVNK
ncbi:phage holin [Virgibacillus sp. YIM 98842]|uniref:phage holin n=1 Tax=Virgibacillus sp. YIM 98842 TaxID=2663533 RepID=UPI0013DC1B89|nr:phage holin [Virgibacillus sp. YIM 98842]